MMEKSKKKEVVDLTNLAEEIVKLGIVLNAPKEEIKDVKISLDSSQDQFTIRIPKGMAKAMEIKPEKDFFRFILGINEKGKLILSGEVMKVETTKN